MIEQIISIAGAILILIAYGAHQWGKMRADGVLYLVLNLIGSLILTYAAIRVHQFGLTLMESAWAVISVAGLVRRRVRSND
jgi:hypothetical protein